MKHSATEITLAIVCILCGLIEGCSGLRIQKHMRPGDSDWTTFGGGPGRTNATTSSLAPPLIPVWEYNAQGGLSTVPLVRDSVVIVTTLHGELQAVNLSNGKRIGYVVLESAIAGTPVLDGGSVIVPLAAKTESLVCYDLWEGKREWVFSAGPIESSPLLYESFLYVTTLDGILYCVSRGDGTEVWKFSIREKDDERAPIRSSPASDGQSIFFGSDKGRVYAVDRSSGRLKWNHAGRAGVFAGPTVVGSSVIVGDLEGTVVCLDSKTGEKKWTYETHSKIYAPASTGKSMVYVGASDGNLHALDVATGERRWVFSARSVFSSPPLVTEHLLYIGSLDRTLYVLNPATGAEVWRYQAEGRIRVSPVLWGTVLLLTSEDKYITALTSGPPL